MTALFFQWVGYLANPARRANIHVELPPQREGDFRLEYQQLTGEPLRLSGAQSPFYVWGPNVNKRGIQRRVYFYGEPQALPPPPGINICKGRADGQWRINNKIFIPELLKFGFRIGDNATRANAIRACIPEKHLPDFDKGFSL